MSKRAAKRREAVARLQVFSLFLLGVVLVLSIVRRDTTLDAHPKMILAGMVAGAAFLLATSVFLAGRWPSRLRTTDVAIIGLALLAGLAYGAFQVMNESDFFGAKGKERKTFEDVQKQALE